MTPPAQLRVLGRYVFYRPIAAGGMATVYLGRMAGPKGFSRIIAIKQLHAQLVSNTDFVTMFVDEAHLIGRIHHSNVVAPIDVVEADGELCIVMEYVHGEALGQLKRLSRHQGIPLRVVSAIMVQTLLGLHAAHEVTDGDGQPLSIVHRDVSPQNVLVGEDGISRVVDFGIAKVAYRNSQSDTGKLKGKLGYMAPEQFNGQELDRRCDIFSAGIILWEMLTGKRLFAGATGPDDAALRMQHFQPKAPSSIVASLSAELDAITLKALAVEPDERFATAHDMARALEAACPPAGAIEVAEWVKGLVGDTLSLRAQWIADLTALDLTEWTQSYVMSLTQSSPPPAMAPMGPAVAPDCAPMRRDVKRRLSLRHLGAAAVLLLVTGVVAGGGFVYRPQRATPAHPPETIAFAATPSTSPSVVSAASFGESQASPVSANASLAPAASSAAPPNAGPPEVAASANNDPSATGRATPESSRTSCRVPYVVDAKGIKRFRPECFR